MAVSKRMRFEVFKRDLFTCQYCGRRPPDVELEADHIIPKCEGGIDINDNLATSCFACNRGKSGIGLGDVAPALDEMEQLEALQEMAERRRLLREQIAAAEHRRELDEEVIGAIRQYWLETFGVVSCFKVASVRRFLQELSVEDLYEAIQLADGISSDQMQQIWKYFCGVCWTKIREKSNDE